MILRFCILIISVAFVQNSYAQFPNLWKTGKTKKINGYSILREEGAFSSTPYIYFTDKEQLTREAVERSENEMWLQADTDSYLSMLDGLSGMMHLHIRAESIDAGNWSNFTVIIQDLDGKELFRENLEDKIPDHDSYGWYNYYNLNIPLGISTPFRAFVINHYYHDPATKRKVYLVQKTG